MTDHQFREICLKHFNPYNADKILCKECNTPTPVSEIHFHHALTRGFKCFRHDVRCIIPLCGICHPKADNEPRKMKMWEEVKQIREQLKQEYYGK